MSNVSLYGLLLQPFVEFGFMRRALVAVLALGVLLISVRGSSVDLVRVLFGTVLAVDDAALLLIAAVSSVGLLALALLYRPLVIECFDPQFQRGRDGALAHLVLLVLTVANMVAGFQALGTLMAVGLLILPAVAARFWAAEVWSLALAAAAIAAGAGIAGLLFSYHAQSPTGPSIVIAAGIVYVASLVVGPRDSLRARAGRPVGPRRR